MAAAASPAEMIPQLEAARKLALADPQVYNQVLPGILPIIGPNAHLEVRRWGADFLAEAFASPSLPPSQKEQLSSEVVPTLRAMLETPGQDMEVTKSVVQAAASLYPLVFRRVYVNVHQGMISMSRTEMNRSNTFVQNFTPQRPGSMAGYEQYEVSHSPAYGFGSSRSQNMLYQVRAEGGAGRDTRSHFRSSSESHLA